MGAAPFSDAYQQQRLSCRATQQQRSGASSQTPVRGTSLMDTTVDRPKSYGHAQQLRACGSAERVSSQSFGRQTNLNGQLADAMFTRPSAAAVAGDVERRAAGLPSRKHATVAAR